MKKVIILILLFFVIHLSATDILLKNGKMILNIEIVAETDEYVEFYVDGSKTRTAKIDIEKTRIAQVRKAAPTKITSTTALTQRK